MPLAALPALLLAACGSSPADPDAGPDAAPLPDAGPTDFRFDTVGVINLLEAGPGGFTGWQSVYAAINDGPYNLLPDRVAAEGDCEVWVRPSSGTCDPLCGPSMMCEANGVCAPFPRTASAGRIEVGGLTVPLAFVPTQFGSYDIDPYPPEDLFVPDATITVTAAGDDTAAFTMSTPAVPPLGGGPYNISFQEGVDFEVTWPPIPVAGAKIQLLLRVGWHGSPVEAVLVCETEDDGFLTIPAALHAELPISSTGLEQHLSSLTRFRRVVHEAEAGPIELFVGSQQFVNFSHF